MTNPARRYSQAEIELVEAFRRGDQQAIDALMKSEGRAGAKAATQPEFPRLAPEFQEYRDDKTVTAGGRTEAPCDALIDLIRTNGRGVPTPDGHYVAPGPYELGQSRDFMGVQYDPGQLTQSYRLPPSPPIAKYVIENNIVTKSPKLEPGIQPAPHAWVKKKITKWVAGFDNHGDMQDTPAVRAFFVFIDEFRPDFRIAGGDHFDFRALRSSASKYEQRDDDELDVKLGFEFLDRLAPTHVLEGNHDKRVRDEIDRGRLGPLTSYCRSLVERREAMCRKHNAQWYPYHNRTGVCQINDLAFVHGYAHSAAACQNHAIAYGDVVFGHGHAIDAYSVRRWPKSHIGMMAGCLCRLDMDYASKNLGSLRWNHGFAFGYFVDDSHVKYQATIVGGQVFTPGLN